MSGPAQHKPVWEARVITLFPDAFPGTLGCSNVGRALASGLWSLKMFDLRNYGVGRHRCVDDSPAGGGPGMVMMPEVVSRAVSDCAVQDSGCPVRSTSNWPIICMSPRGRPFNQHLAERWSRIGGMTIICGRFEGIDERVFVRHDIEEISIGDFVLSGGEIAAQALIEATVRLIPTVLGNEDSATEESFASGLLEYPQYTRPRDWNGFNVPEVLTSGHHGRIAEWRQAMSEELTKSRRPDLWQAYKRTRIASQECRSGKTIR